MLQRNGPLESQCTQACSKSGSFCADSVLCPGCVLSKCWSHCTRQHSDAGIDTREERLVSLVSLKTHHLTNMLQRNGPLESQCTQACSKSGSFCADSVLCPGCVLSKCWSHCTRQHSDAGINTREERLVSLVSLKTHHLPNMLQRNGPLEAQCTQACSKSGSFCADSVLCPGCVLSKCWSHCTRQHSDAGINTREERLVSLVSLKTHHLPNMLQRNGPLESQCTQACSKSGSFCADSVLCLGCVLSKCWSHCTRQHSDAGIKTREERLVSLVSLKTHHLPNMLQRNGPLESQCTQACSKSGSFCADSVLCPGCVLSKCWSHCTRQHSDAGINTREERLVSLVSLKTHHLPNMLQRNGPLESQCTQACSKSGSFCADSVLCPGCVHVCVQHTSYADMDASSTCTHASIYQAAVEGSWAQVAGKLTAHWTTCQFSGCFLCQGLFLQCNEPRRSMAAMGGARHCR